MQFLLAKLPSLQLCVRRKKWGAVFNLGMLKNSTSIINISPDLPSEEVEIKRTASAEIFEELSFSSAESFSEFLRDSALNEMSFMITVFFCYLIMIPLTIVIVCES